MVEQTHTGGRWPSLAEPWRAMAGKFADWFAPASEAATAADAYEISVELPGVGIDDIDLSLEDGVLTLKGEKRTSREEKTEHYFFSERQYGAFSRSFRLPADAAEENLSADMKDGVLTVTIPKQGESKSSAQRIKVTQA